MKAIQVSLAYATAALQGGAHVMHTHRHAKPEDHRLKKTTTKHYSQMPLPPSGAVTMSCILIDTPKSIPVSPNTIKK